MTAALDCLIVGAGIAGVMAARRLQEAGRSVLVIDKARGVGGRMATRRVNDAVLDHGAQFFTVRSDVFAGFVEDWLRAGVVREWSRGFPRDFDSAGGDGHPRYCGEGGMTAVVKHLGRGLDIRCGRRVRRAGSTEGGWRLEAESGPIAEGSALLMTCPVPQSLTLLEAGGVALPPDDGRALRRIEYDPCLALLAVLDGPSGLSAPGAVQIDAEPVSWIADNHRKGVSPGAHALTVHAAPGFSRDRWDRPDEETVTALWQAVSPRIGARLAHWQLQRWRFAQPTTLHPDRCLVAGTHAPLVLAGDAFGGPKVEGAALSGLAAAESLLRLLD